MRLRHIEAFHAVMSTGSVRAAAEWLHLTQSAVSHTISHAEQELGFTLFRRSKGHLIPTPEAQALHREAMKVYESLEHLKRMARNIRQASVGLIRVGAIPALCHELLVDVIAVFRTRYPEVEIRVHTLHKQEIIQALLLRDIDLALDYFSLEHPSIESVTLADFGLYVLIPLSDANPAPGSVNLKELQTRPLVALPETDPIMAEVLQACDRLEVTLHPVIDVQTSRMAVGLVERGLGWAVTDAFTAHNAPRAQIAVARLQPKLSCPLCINHLREQPFGIAAERFIEHIRDICRQVTFPS